MSRDHEVCVTVLRPKRSLDALEFLLPLSESDYVVPMGVIMGQL